MNERGTICALASAPFTRPLFFSSFSEKISHVWYWKCFRNQPLLLSSFSQGHVSPEEPNQGKSGLANFILILILWRRTKPGCISPILIYSSCLMGFRRSICWVLVDYSMWDVSRLSQENGSTALKLHLKRWWWDQLASSAASPSPRRTAAATVAHMTTATLIATISLYYTSFLSNFNQRHKLFSTIKQRHSYSELTNRGTVLKGTVIQNYQAEAPINYSELSNRDTHRQLTLLAPFLMSFTASRSSSDQEQGISRIYAH